jgi:outer membrane protein assembly factor BamB
MNFVMAVVLAQAAAQEKTAPLGSSAFKPSADRPVGWRGDGSGRFPGATPPLNWSRTKDGNGYAARNLLWATPLPDSGVSSPIVAAGRIFLTAGYSDLVCIDAATGRILWIRSNAEVEALTPEERKAEPAFAEKLDPLLPKLAQANADAVEALNGLHASALTAPYKAPEALARKRAVEKQLRDGIQAIDRKKFGLNWAQVIYGYSTETPASDGKMVCALFGTGVAVGYDLNGNRKWIARGAIGGEEKGHYTSPVIVGKQFVVWGDPEIRAYDVETGKLLWKNPAKGSNAGSLFRFRTAGGDWVAGLQTSCFVRLRDGAPIWKGPELNYSFTTSIVEGDTLYAWSAGGNKDFKAWSIPAGTDGGALKPRLTFKKPEWGAEELTGKFDKGDVNASPLYVDGLLYHLYPGGGLVVHDAASGEVVYRKVLPMKARVEYWGWGGASASPALAGRNLYLIDNQGTTVVLAPGRQYKELAVNRIEETHDGRTQVQNLASPWFDGPRLYFRTAGHLYCIGER